LTWGFLKNVDTNESESAKSTTINKTMPAALFTVTLMPENLQFQADRDKTILQSAERAQIYPLSSCRNGTCRTCISTLISGEICYNIDWPGLSAEEKQVGLMLPCCAQPLSNMVMRFGA
jgi:ferredoxin